ncbi:MAG: hypothetical protein ACPGRZ_14705 [Alphaproteobacteria bacterium]
MRKYLATIAAGALLAVVSQPAATAAPFTVSFTATIAQSGGSYAGDLDPGVGLTGAISLSTTEADAFNAITTPSTTPGHEFTSF